MCATGKSWGKNVSRSRTSSWFQNKILHGPGKVSKIPTFDLDGVFLSKYEYLFSCYPIAWLISVLVGEIFIKKYDMTNKQSFRTLRWIKFFVCEVRGEELIIIYYSYNGDAVQIGVG